MPKLKRSDQKEAPVGCMLDVMSRGQCRHKAAKTQVRLLGQMKQHRPRENTTWFSEPVKPYVFVNRSGEASPELFREAASSIDVEGLAGLS